ncbi:NAD(P)-binding domain-containing protein [Planosporangium thailandense]|uniref:NAD(P)-binding domain-containing protein n=1 Tax=Planosporangium thailandense TaxID=765197 RepID=A0ABX0XRE5_9ACTN|nr:NAD(P)-binding domain-containing protein [Planosporangium thailandense]NJC68571.1 NAD(P)-binding domain-containing protein [Planosporangium thailandense]
MKIAVLGTGMVGQALAGRLAELGHEVTVGTRDVAATLSRSEPDAMGNPPYSTWATSHPDVRLAPFAEAAAGAELLVNATSGHVSLATLQSAGADNLAGKILLDIANPLDFSQGFPPTLFVKDTDSLAEQLQAAFPDLKVVKALNTLTAALMVNPRQLADGDHTVFVAGNDADAKKTVTDLLESFGHRDVIDLGDLTAARGTEMLLPIWLRLMGTLNTPMFNIKVVR